MISLRAEILCPFEEFEELLVFTLEIGVSLEGVVEEETEAEVEAVEASLVLFNSIWAS